MEHPFHPGELRFSTDGLAALACQTGVFAALAPQVLRELTQPAETSW